MKTGLDRPSSQPTFQLFHPDVNICEDGGFEHVMNKMTQFIEATIPASEDKKRLIELLNSEEFKVSIGLWIVNGIHYKLNHNETETSVFMSTSFKDVIDPYLQYRSHNHSRKSIPKRRTLIGTIE